MWGTWFHASMEHKPKSRMVMRRRNTYFPENKDFIILISSMLKSRCRISFELLVDSVHHGGSRCWKNQPYLQNDGGGQADPSQTSSPVSGLVELGDHQGTHGHGTPSAFLTYLPSHAFGSTPSAYLG